MVNSAPPPGAFATAARPWCSSAMAATIDSPSPTPPRVRAPSARQKRSKTCASASSRETLTVVADADLGATADQRGADLDRGAARGVPQRVDGQVGDRLAEVVAVAGDDHGAGRLERDRARRVDGHRVGARVGGEHGEVDGVALGRAGLVEAGEQQQVVDEHVHPRRLLLDPPHHRVPVEHVVATAHAEQLGEAADRRQRGAQLVGARRRGTGGADPRWPAARRTTSPARRAWCSAPGRAGRPRSGCRPG